MTLEYLFNRCEYKPHRGQLKVHSMARLNRYLGVLFGRRGGKSHCASFESVETLFQPPHPVFGAPVGLITAPTVDLTKAVFERTHDLIFKYFKSYKPRYRRSDRYIELEKLGSELYVRSGDKPKSLVSRGYSKVVIDEAGFFEDRSFRELKPALLDRTGSLVAIGVPSLKNWYFDLYKSAKRKEKGHGMIQLPSIVNPAISVEEWHNLFKTTPRLEFLRQYCAKFNEDDLNVWSSKDLDEALIDDVFEDYDSNFTYYAGLDLARKQDYTVLTIVKPVNKFIKAVFSLQLQGQWKNQVVQIADILNYYNVVVCSVDTTGVGDAVIELLADKTMTGLESFVFTNDSKTQLVDFFSVELEQGNLLIPRLFNYQDELKMYEFSVSKTGLRVFSAPAGYNDDKVISLLLAVRALRFNHYV